MSFIYFYRGVLFLFGFTTHRSTYISLQLTVEERRKKKLHTKKNERKRRERRLFNPVGCRWGMLSKSTFDGKVWITLVSL